MSGTVPVVASPWRDPERERLRRRRAFQRKAMVSLLVLVLLGVIGYLSVMAITRTNPLQAWQLMASGIAVFRESMTPTPPFGGREQVTILLLGADVAFDDSGCARTDTIKLVTVNFANPRITILSIPRDTWVEIPGHGHARINSAYQYGGNDEETRLALARDTVSNFIYDTTGEAITIDHYVRLQTGGFIKIVDAMGGIELDVEKQMDYEDPSQELYIHLKPGVQLLDGEQAMGYVRFRMDAEADFGRIRRQDQFIRAVAAKLRSPEMRKRLPGLIGPIMSMMRTDIAESDLLAIKSVVETVGIEGMHTLRLPTEATWKGRALVEEVHDLPAARRMVAELLHGPRPTVMVLNGTQRDGLASRVRDTLRTCDVNVVGVGTTVDPVEHSAVLTVPRRKPDASALAATLGIDAVLTEEAPPPAVFDRSMPPIPPPVEVTIVLGSDFSGPYHASAVLPAGNGAQ